MLDIQFIRDNAQLVAEKSAQKGYHVEIPALLDLDKQRRAWQTSIEELRQERNRLAGDTKQQRPTDEQVVAGKKVKEELAHLEEQLKKVDEQYWEFLKAVPNMPLDDVPVGATEDENVVAKKVGEPTEYDFAPKNHWEIARAKRHDRQRTRRQSFGQPFCLPQG